MVGCWRCTYPSIHLFVSRSRSVVRGATVCSVLCVHEGVVLCEVLCWCWCLVVVVVLCGGVVCLFVSFSLFSLSSLLSLSCSRSFFLFSSFLLLSSLLATAANFEAFECDLAHSKCTAVGSLPPPLSSLLLSLPPLLKERTFHYRKNPARELFKITF